MRESIRNLILYTTLFFISIFLGCNSKNKDNFSGDFPVIQSTNFAAIELGRLLFFDTRLSLDSSISCASCHQSKHAFTDNKQTAVGIFDRQNPRNSPTLFNVKDAPHLMFDNVIPNLEMQVIVPIQEHNEMGMTMKAVLDRIKTDSNYQKLSQQAFRKPLDAFVLTRSIAAFERTLISNNSRFDQFIRGDTKALDRNEKEGWRLFSEEFNCIACHNLPNFTNYQAKNNGLTVINKHDMGRYRATGDSADFGKFKVPSLRNITLTAPYMHDGSYQNLEAVVTAYGRGGVHFDNKDSLIIPFEATSEKVKNLIFFFETLVDTITYKAK